MSSDSLVPFTPQLPDFGVSAEPVYELDVYSDCLNLHNEFCRTNNLATNGQSFFSCPNYASSTAGDHCSFDMWIRKDASGLVPRLSVYIEFVNDRRCAIEQKILMRIGRDGVTSVVMEPNSKGEFSFFPQLAKEASPFTPASRNIALSAICLRARVNQLPVDEQ